MRLCFSILWALLMVYKTLGIQQERSFSSSRISFNSKYSYQQSVITTTTITPPSKQVRSFSDSSSSGFVCAPGDGHLYLNGQLFDFRVFNTPTLFETDSKYEVKDLLETITGFGTPVTRTYTLQVANDMFPGGSMSSSKANIIGWDENSQDWKYNETVWRKMDYALDLSRQYGVKLIIPIINQDYGLSESDFVGNFNDLIRHRYNITEYGVANKAVDWFTDRIMIDSFKLIITYLMDRVNTFNGIRYGDDDTILAFETGNELNWGDSKRVTFVRTPPAAWTLEIAQHMKSLAPNLLVMDGSFSRSAKNGTYWEKSVLDSKLVDLFSYHLYGDGDVDLYDGLRNEVRAHGKTLIIGEHGFYANITTYSKAYEKFDCAGALLWSLRGHSEKGGFVTHGEGNNIYSYHAPGWRNQTSKSFDPQEADVVSATYDASFAVIGQEPPPYPTPGTPQIFFITNGTHAGLSWRGATWADHYEIYGGHFEGFSFNTISNQVLDNVGAGELFIPLDPEQPTKTLLLPPKAYIPFESQAGWTDTKWCVPDSNCYEPPIYEGSEISNCGFNYVQSKSISTSNFSNFQSKKKKSSSNNNNENENKYKVLPLMFPSSHGKRNFEGGWYSVRGVNSNGIPGKGSKALFLKSNWFNWTRTD